ncbi:hypothetical protein [Burkholderia pseudomallei]|uniref:hypothetical protein n=1 Tax=Burkholderia pseudomallei TaxID=28450 RepID=UPI003F685AD5
MSTERVIAAHSIADALVDNLAANARTLRSGNTRAGVPYGQMPIRDAALSAVALVDDAVPHSVVVAGSRRVERGVDRRRHARRNARRERASRFSSVALVPFAISPESGCRSRTPPPSTSGTSLPA